MNTSVNIFSNKSLFQRITSFQSIFQIYAFWVPISAVEGPHFTQNWVPIKNILGPHSMWEQCKCRHLRHEKDIFIQVEEEKRGVFSGVETSLCYGMDLIKFVLVRCHLTFFSLTQTLYCVDKRK